MIRTVLKFICFMLVVLSVNWFVYSVLFYLSSLYILNIFS